MTITFAQVQEVIAATLRLPAARISEDTSDSNLAAWDSLGQVNLVMAIEQRFDLYIEVEDFDRLRSVAAIIDYLRTRDVA